MVIQWPFWMWLGMWVMFLLTGLVLLTLRRLIDGLQDDTRDLQRQLDDMGELVQGQAVITNNMLHRELARMNAAAAAEDVPDANN